MLANFDVYWTTLSFELCWLIQPLEPHWHTLTRVTTIILPHPMSIVNPRYILSTRLAQGLDCAIRWYKGWMSAKLGNALFQRLYPSALLPIWLHTSQIDIDKYGFLILTFSSNLLRLLCWYIPLKNYFILTLVVISYCTNLRKYNSMY